MAWLGLRDRIVAALCLLLAVGCTNAEESPRSAPPEPVGQLTQPLTSSELSMLGFETMAWASIWNPATLAQSTLHTEGAFSLKITNIGYTAVRHSPALASDGNAFSVVGYDIRIPPLNEQPNPWWFGDTWLYIDAPSKGVNLVNLGSKPLKNPGQFTRMEFAIPASIRTALAGNYSDLKFTIAVNTTPGNGAHYLDRFTLGPGTCQPQDDNNPCTEDTCNSAGQPIHTPKPVGTSCSDSDLCNGSEICNATGVCQAGTPPLIDDSNPCTTDGCTPAVGVTHTPVAAGTSCSDANACNGTEVCNATAVCTPGAAPPIDDGNLCTADSCDPATGVQHVALPSGTACANGDACDGAEVCNASGTCQSGAPPPIDDGNPCTADSCDPEDGVLHVPVSAGTSCSDANACNGSEICNGAGGCAPGTPPAVDDGNPCTADSCDPVTGVAHNPVPTGTACADADLCNGTELCNGVGVCVAGAPSAIDDGNPCTADSCDPATGVAHVPLPAGSSCSDDTVCNGAEVCSASAACQPGTPLDPDDDNPCTIDACDPVAGVQHQPTPGASCADGDVCNGAEVCSSAGTCAAGTPLDPDDQNPCTADSCDPVSGVTNLPVAGGTSCADGDVCNGTELCDASGSCQPSPPLDPDDQNPCTADSCDPINGIENTPEPAGASCSDDDVCTGGEVCDGAGTCDPGAPLDPDDGNPCTEDSCDPVAGVVNSPVADGTVCSDDDACTQTDSCQAGSCAGSSPVVCTAQNQCHAAGTCDPATGACSNPLLADGTACDDSDACTQGETCTAGTCESGSPLDVDDGNPCTADSCDAQGGVTHTPVAAGTSCDDVDLCNGAAVCDASGVCQAGTPLTCNDGNACNGVESCLPATGCASGAPPLVDDSNPCTADSCDPVTGVDHDPVAAGTSCDDGDACNGLEACDGAGACQAGAGSSVDDGNPCTLDSCDPIDGVVHTPAPSGTSCDLDACTVGGSCDSGGFCVGGTSVVPDDGDPCTVETCDPETGVRASVCTENSTVATTVPGSMAFLYTGANPAQQGVDPATIVVERAASIAGRVLDRDSVAVAGVRVAIAGHPEFGFTNTQSDGSYQLVVNGGGPLRVTFARPPYLAVERQALLGWGERTTVPDVVLVAPDAAVTTIDLQDTGEPFQVHEASVVSDSDGTRQAVLLVPAGTQATMEFPDGTQTSIDTLNVRVTEFTVGDTGILAMPGELPAISAYTHAFEVNADEAVQAGARSIAFDQPLIYYTDNFLEFPAGTTVPVGSFNRERGQWLAEENGIVIAITAIVGGIAQLDADGDGDPETDAELEGLGIDFDERAKIAELRTPGESLWRVRIPHFTEPYDCNWGILFPDDAEPPPDPPQPPPDPPNKCEGSGSIIECETQVLREVLPLAGTEFSLNYASNRVPGRKDYRTMRIPLSGPAVPASLKRIDLEVKVGGLSWKESFAPLPSQTYDFVWDGHDGLGRSLQGSQGAEAMVRFTYDGVYARTAQFGAVAGVALTGSMSRNELYMTRRREQAVGIWDARVMGFGGWTLNVHHAYEPSSGTLQLGDGRRVQALPNQRIVESWPKKLVSDSTTYPDGDGGPADVAGFQRPGAIAVAPDGTIYVADGHDPWQSTEPYNLRRIGPDGIIDRFAGLGYDGPRGFNGDGLPALQTEFSDMSDIEVGPDGSVFVADRGNHRVRRIGPDGIVTTVAGTGTQGFSGDGGLATDARLNEPRGIGLGRGGEIYIADYGNRRVRKVLPNGNIVTIGGNGAAPGSTNPGDGAAMGVADRMAPYDVAEHPDGSVYALESVAA